MTSITEPVHEHIRISEAEKDLINSPLVQRLQWIGQLTGTRHVFPGGIHTRFTHSTGAMYVAGRYMSQLFEGFEENVERVFGKSEKYFIQVARIAALLHDVAHGPFSHSFDRTVYKPIYGVPDNGHDLHRFELIKSDLLKNKIENCGILVEDIEKVWKSTKEYLKDNKLAMYHIIHCITQGPLGADRIDFTKRDSYFTGSKQFGTIADKRIIYQASIQRNAFGEWCLCYSKSCISNIIQALDGRKYMYNNVYFHKVSMASALLIERMMEACTEVLQLTDRVKYPTKFQDIHDVSLIGDIMHLPNDPTTNEPHPAKVYCERFMKRKLPKMIKEILYIPKNVTVPIDPDIPDSAILMESKVFTGIDAEKFDEWGIYFHDPSPNNNENNNKSNETIKGTIKSAAKILNEMNYVPQSPFKIMRWYLL